jgi:hypothetical protein
MSENPANNGDSLPAAKFDSYNRRRRRGEIQPPSQDRQRKRGKAEIWVRFEHLGYRRVFDDDNRDEAIALARENIRREGSAVSANRTAGAR